MKDSLSNRINAIVGNKNFEDSVVDIPKNMLIEVTNACNENCIFCANSKSNRTRSNINDEFVKKILKEAYELGVEEVGFYTTGEPLLNNNLKDYILDAKLIGFKYIYLTTNGVLANLQNMRTLIDNGLNSIKFSINAINEKDYKFIHGVDKFNAVMENLKSIYEYKKDNNLNFKVYVSYIATKYTLNNIDDIKKFFKDLCDDIAIINARNQSGMMPENDLFLLSENSDNINGKQTLPCYYPFKTISVSKEGYLTACCTDFNNYLAIDDLNKKSLIEVWNSEKFIELRKKHLADNLQGTMCYNCIHGSKELPEPINKDLYTKMLETVYTDYSDVLNRIECR